MSKAELETLANAALLSARQCCAPGGALSSVHILTDENKCMPVRLDIESRRTKLALQLLEKEHKAIGLLTTVEFNGSTIVYVLWRSRQALVQKSCTLDN